MKNPSVPGNRTLSLPAAMLLFFTTCCSWILSCMGILLNKNTCLVLAGFFFLSASGTAQVQWSGNNDTDWQNTGNWIGGVIPTATDNVNIPASAAIFPVVTSPASVMDINIEPGAFLTVNGSSISIGGSINNAGIFDVSLGTVELNGSSAQVIPANAFENNTILNLVISNNVTLAGVDTLTGTLYFGTSNKEFTTGDFLILKSTASKTARVHNITNNGADSANTINGKITIERYFPLRKAWRLLTAPVDTTGAPTINEAWQEAVTTAASNPNPHPGYGVGITGGATTYGFDQSITNSPSIKVYNNATNALVALPSIPGTDRPISDYPGYFVYIRGDRSIDLMQGTGAAITPTTIRMKGKINTNLQIRGVNANGYTLLGNPYPSAIDFQKCRRNNVNNSFYMWDPEMSGNFGLGGYVAFSWNDETLSYDATASVSPLSQFIPAGEAIFVQSEDGVTDGTIDINENCKDAGSSRLSSNNINGLPKQLRVNMYGINADNSISLLDGVLTTYSNLNSNGIDNRDAKKMFGSSESLNLKRGTGILSIERRANILASDTSFLNIYQMKQKPYRLEISMMNLDTSGLMAFLADSYDNSINNTPLNLNGTTFIYFNVNATPASYSPSRFNIVFKMMSVVPIHFETINAYKKDKDIEVDWSTSDEINVNHYDVERAADGSHFNNINTTIATANNGGKVFYKMLDGDPLHGDNYYRIRSVSNYGSELYSNVVKVRMMTAKDEPAISLFPNPVKNGNLTVQFSRIPQGTYDMSIYNKLGELVAKTVIDYNGVDNQLTFRMMDQLAAGKYELTLKGQGIKLSYSVLKQ